MAVWAFIMAGMRADREDMRRQRMPQKGKRILWAMVLVGAFLIGFGLGAALWEDNAYRYVLWWAP